MVNFPFLDNLLKVAFTAVVKLPFSDVCIYHCINGPCECDTVSQKNIYFSILMYPGIVFEINGL